MKYMFDITAETAEEAKRRVMILLDLVSLGEETFNPDIYIKQVGEAHYEIYDKRRDPDD